MLRQRGWRPPRPPEGMALAAGGFSRPDPPSTSTAASKLRDTRALGCHCCVHHAATLRATLSRGKRPRARKASTPLTSSLEETHSPHDQCEDPSGPREARWSPRAGGCRVLRDSRAGCSALWANQPPSSQAPSPPNRKRPGDHGSHIRVFPV